MAHGHEAYGRLLDAASRLARRRGFDRTSVNDVIAASGVKKGSFFHHFPDKDSLGLAVLERDRIRFMEMIDTCLAAPTPLDGLDRFLAQALRKHRQTGFIGGCLWGNTALEMSDSNPVFAGRVARVFADWTGKLARTIRAGQQRGQVRGDLPAGALARTMVAAVEGGIMLSRLTKRAAPLRNCLQTVRAMLRPAAPTRRSAATRPRRRKRQSQRAAPSRRRRTR